MTSCIFFWLNFVARRRKSIPKPSGMVKFIESFFSFINVSLSRLRDKLIPERPGKSSTVVTIRAPNTACQAFP